MQLCGRFSVSDFMNIVTLIISLFLTATLAQVLSVQSEKDTKSTKVPVFEQIHSDVNGAVSEFVWFVYNDSKGNYWFGTNGDGLIKYDGNEFTKYYKVIGIGSAVRDVVESISCDVWFGSSDGVLRFNREGFQKFTIADGLPSNDVWSLGMGSDDVLWVGTSQGICKFVDGKFVTIDLPTTNVKETRPMISENRIVDISIQSDGRMQIGLDGNGMWEYNGNEFYQHTTSNGLHDDFVSSINSSNGNIWVGTYHEGIAKYDGKSFTSYKGNGEVSAYEIRKIITDNLGNIWFTTESRGVYKYDGKNFTNYTTDNGLVSNNVLGIDQDRNGKIWVTTWQGLSIFEDDKFVNASEVYEWLD